MSFAKYTKLKPFKFWNSTLATTRTVQGGSFILYKETTQDEVVRTRLARVLQRVTKFPDGTEPHDKEVYISVVAVAGDYRFGYERIIKKDDIAEVLDDDMIFMKWFMNFKDLDAENIHDLQRYGALSSNYLSKHLNSEGEIDEHWRLRSLHSSHGYALFLGLRPDVNETPDILCSWYSGYLARSEQAEVIATDKGIVLVWHFDDVDEAIAAEMKLRELGVRALRSIRLSVAMDPKSNFREAEYKEWARDLLKS